MPEPLTMSAEREASLRATLPRSIFSMAVFAEIDALRGRVAELERERDRLRAPRYQHARKMWIAESLMDDALTMRTADGRFLLTFQMGEPDEDGFYTPLITSHEDDAFKALTDERAALRSEVERLRAALSGVLEMCRDPHNANESFERVGELYCRATGQLRPGKDDPFRDSSDPENVKRFDEWYATEWAKRHAVATAALPAPWSAQEAPYAT